MEIIAIKCIECGRVHLAPFSHYSEETDTEFYEAWCPVYNHHTNYAKGEAIVGSVEDE